jgi:hypothetical protein
MLGHSARRPIAFVAVAIVAFSASTSLAWGRKSSSPPLSDPSFVSYLALRASNAYQLSIEGFPEEGDSGTIVLEAISATNSGVENARYIVPGTVTSRRLEADFGALGNLSLRFHPSGRLQLGPPACGDARLWRKRGILTGSLTFHGELGYAESAVHRVRGQIESPLLTPAPLQLPLGKNVLTVAALLGCIGKSTGGGGDSRTRSNSGTVGLQATASSLSFAAGKPSFLVPPRPDVELSSASAEHAVFDASLEESVGRTAIMRGVFATGAESTFGFDPGLTSALLLPPAPFTGSAAFSRGAGPSTWTGDLAVAFPGTASVPLTGPSFEAKLAREKTPTFSGSFFGEKGKHAKKHGKHPRRRANPS